MELPSCLDSATGVAETVAQLALSFGAAERCLLLADPSGLSLMARSPEDWGQEVVECAKQFL